MHSSPLSKQFNTATRRNRIASVENAPKCATNTFRIDCPSSQVGRNSESLVDRTDRFDRYHKYMDSSRHRYRLKKKSEQHRYQKKVSRHTQFTIGSFETSAALACIRAIQGTDTGSSILARLITAAILVFASLASETWRALTNETTYSICHASGTIQTRIRRTSISWNPEEKMVTCRFHDRQIRRSSSLVALRVSQRGPVNSDGHTH